MNEEKDLIGNYEVSRFPRERITTLDFLAVSDIRHYVKGLFELDVTDGRNIIKNYKEKPRKDLSFTSWLLYCIGTAASEYNEVHSIMKGRKKIVKFEDVDISIAVEREIRGKKAVIPVIIRKTNEKLKTLKQQHY